MRKHDKESLNPKCISVYLVISMRSVSYLNFGRQTYSYITSKRSPVAVNRLVNLRTTEFSTGFLINSMEKKDITTWASTDGEFRRKPVWQLILF